MQESPPIDMTTTNLPDTEVRASPIPKNGGHESSEVIDSVENKVHTINGDASPHDSKFEEEEQKIPDLGEPAKTPEQMTTEKPVDTISGETQLNHASESNRIDIRADPAD